MKNATKEKNSVTDLIKDALKQDDYEFRINFLIAGLISAEENDTEEKRKQNNEWLEEIMAFAAKPSAYDGERAEYLNRIADTIDSYLHMV